MDGSTEKQQYPSRGRNSVAEKHASQGPVKTHPATDRDDSGVPARVGPDSVVQILIYTEG